MIIRLPIFARSVRPAALPIGWFIGSIGADGAWRAPLYPKSSLPTVDFCAAVAYSRRGFIGEFFRASSAAAIGSHVNAFRIRGVSTCPFLIPALTPVGAWRSIPLAPRMKPSGAAGAGASVISILVDDGTMPSPRGRRNS